MNESLYLLFLLVLFLLTISPIRSAYVDDTDSTQFFITTPEIISSTENTEISIEMKKQYSSSSILSQTTNITVEATNTLAQINTFTLSKSADTTINRFSYSNGVIHIYFIEHETRVELQSLTSNGEVIYFDEENTFVTVSWDSSSALAQISNFALLAKANSVIPISLSFTGSTMYKVSLAQIKYDSYDNSNFSSSNIVIFSYDLSGLVLPTHENFYVLKNGVYYKTTFVVNFIKTVISSYCYIVNSTVLSIDFYSENIALSDAVLFSDDTLSGLITRNQTEAHYVFNTLEPKRYPISLVTTSATIISSYSILVGVYDIVSFTPSSIGDNFITINWKYPVNYDTITLMQDLIEVTITCNKQLNDQCTLSGYQNLIKGPSVISIGYETCTSSTLITKNFDIEVNPSIMNVRFQ